MYRSYYPHRSRELVSPVCGIFVIDLEYTMDKSGILLEYPWHIFGLSWPMFELFLSWCIFFIKVTELQKDGNLWVLLLSFSPLPPHQTSPKRSYKSALPASLMGHIWSIKWTYLWHILIISVEYCGPEFSIFCLILCTRVSQQLSGQWPTLSSLP